MGKKRILQMMNADGWYATFISPDGGRCTVKLICWVLVEENGETTVQGLHSGGGFTAFCEEVGNFEDYVHESETGQHG